MEQFNDFVRAGKPGEFCRLYRNINERDMDRVRKSLICRLTMEDGIDLSKIERVTASIAMKHENAAEHKWLFDFDCEDEDKLREFVADVHKCSPIESVEYSKTPDGYDVITSNGFDSSDLQEKWKHCVELKRDGMTCVYWTKRNPY